MGNRVSIQFETDGMKSAVLYSHWDGWDLVGLATEYVRRLKADAVTDDTGGPLNRLESDSVMFNFMWWLQRQAEWRSPTDLYCTVGGYRLTPYKNQENRGHHVIRCDRKKERVYFAVDADGHAVEVLGARTASGAIERIDEQYYVLHGGDGGLPMRWDFAIYSAPSSDVMQYADGKQKLHEVMRPGAAGPRLEASGTHCVDADDMKHSAKCHKCNLWGWFHSNDGCPKCGGTREMEKEAPVPVAGSR
ncbi:MAG: hypothetical protein J4F28_01990 [Nitrosopumilaceae archaeon]|nr:hypothetical protein [Nitrosopumilaceae archaeon]